MKQVFYLAGKESRDFLYPKISEYNDLLRKLYTKDSSNSSELKDKKQSLQKEIENYIKKNCTVTGFLNESEMEKYHQLKQIFKDENIKFITDWNIIEDDDLSLFYKETEKLQIEKSIKEKLTFFLKEAIKNNKALIIWIF
jgi:hypothetical protein